MSTIERGKMSWLLERLRRARETAGFSQADVAERLGIARTTMVAIERGERQLRPDEMVLLADLYGQRLDELMRPAAPPEQLTAQFRQVIGRMDDHEELEDAVLQLQQLVEDYVELERLLDAPLQTSYPAPRPLPMSNPFTAADRLADEERGRLHLGDGPVPHLRNLLESDVGIRVFSLPLPGRIAGLFAFNETLGACVAINSRQRWERQQYSLAHEYAHFLSRRPRPEVTVVLAAYQRVPAAERFADAFAQRFLMPRTGLERRFAVAQQATPGKLTLALIFHQADLWNVSPEAMTRRLEDLKLVRPGAWDELVRRGVKPDEGREMLGLPVREPDAVLLPRRYMLLAAAAYREGHLSEERLARFLRTDRVAARRMVDGLAPELLTLEPDNN